jgi:hypothetical protein
VPAMKRSTKKVSLTGNPILVHKHFGLDISCIIHASLRNADCADEYNMLPRIPLTSFNKEFSKMVIGPRKSKKALSL